MTIWQSLTSVLSAYTVRKLHDPQLNAPQKSKDQFKLWNCHRAYGKGHRFHAAWYTITDRMTYLPGIKGKLTYNVCFHDLAIGKAVALSSFDASLTTTIRGANSRIRPNRRRHQGQMDRLRQ